MKNCGIEGILLIWLRNYLRERKRHVCRDGIRSSDLSESVGAAQGGVIGPILFILYLNKIKKALEHSKSHINNKIKKIIRKFK